MKQVTIENVRQRVELLAMYAGRDDGYRLSLNEEFELACLGRLVELMQAAGCAYAFEARPIDGSNSAASLCVAVCKLCGSSPSPVIDNTAQQFEALAVSPRDYELQSVVNAMRTTSAVKVKP